MAAKNVNLAHFKNLVIMSAADGNIDKEEVTFLAYKAKEFGIEPHIVDEILKNPSNFSITIPESHDEKEEMLSEVVYMAMIDGEIHEKEYNLCLSFAQKLGLEAREVDEVIALVKRLWK